MNKSRREMLRAIKQHGFKVAHERSNKHCVLTLEHPELPGWTRKITIPSSTSDVRARKNMAALLRRWADEIEAGILH